jgi:hypothetical protein
MSWTGTISSGSVAQDAAIWLELNHAMRQRQQMLAHAVANAWPASGDTLQTHAKIEEMQQFVVDHFADCVQSHDADGSARADDYYDGKTPDLPLWTLADGYASAGMNASGFTRLLPNGSSAYGIIQADDCLCTQLVNELRAMFTRMVWTRKPTLHVTDSGRRRYGGYSDPSDWGTAKTQAIAVYGAASETTFDDWTQAWTNLYWTAETPAKKRAEVNRQRIDRQCTGIPTALACTADFYVRSWGGYSYWSAHGDVVASGLQRFYESVGPSSNATRTVTIGRTGAGDVPTDWGPEPIEPEAAKKGYLMTMDNQGLFPDALLRWNVAGGLTEY